MAACGYPDRKSTRLNSSPPMYLVCRLLLEKKRETGFHRPQGRGSRPTSPGWGARALVVLGVRDGVGGNCAGAGESRLWLCIFFFKLTAPPQSYPLSPHIGPFS